MKGSTRTGCGSAGSPPPPPPFWPSVSLDWLWLLPGLVGLGFLALGLAAGGDENREEKASGSTWSLGRLAIGGLLAAATISVIFLFLGDLYVRKARVEAYGSPGAELSAARTAAWFNRVSVTPLYLEASALETEGHRAEAKAEARRRAGSGAAQLRDPWPVR